MARPKSKTKKILFAVEIIVLLLFIGGLYVYGQLNSKLDKINQPVLDDGKIKVNQEVQDSINSQESTLTGYTTYALFGIDHRDKNTALGGENSDTIIIASVNNDTKDVKLVSVYRDTLLNLGNDTYSKANAAYAYGEAEQAITMLNTNLDLNISEYATVNFNALTTIIDDLGGLDMDMSYAEIVHMNNYCVETSEETGKDYTPIELPDRPDDIEAVQYHYHLNGVQATSYCRIRYTASLDMGRTERQRRVIQMIVSKAKSAGLGKIFKIMDDVFPMVTTSMTKDEILQLLPTLIGYSVDDTTGFPTSYKFSNVKGSIIVPTTLETNVIELHKFLYGDEAYTPSATVKQTVKRFLKSSVVRAVWTINRQLLKKIQQMTLLFLKRMEVAGLIQALITVLTAIAPVVETIVVMRLITAVVLLLVAEITVMMVPTTVVMTVPVAETMKDQRLRNRITAEMTTVVETPAEMKAVAETPAETKAVAETSLTKAVEMTVERLQRRQALLMLLKFIKIRR